MTVEPKLQRVFNAMHPVSEHQQSCAPSTGDNRAKAGGWATRHPFMTEAEQKVAAESHHRPSAAETGAKMARQLPCHTVPTRTVREPSVQDLGFERDCLERLCEVAALIRFQELKQREFAESMGWRTSAWCVPNSYDLLDSDGNNQPSRMAERESMAPWLLYLNRHLVITSADKRQNGWTFEAGTWQQGFDPDEFEAKEFRLPWAIFDYDCSRRDPLCTLATPLHLMYCMTYYDDLDDLRVALRVRRNCGSLYYRELERIVEGPVSETLLNLQELAERSYFVSSWWRQQCEEMGFSPAQSGCPFSAVIGCFYKNIMSPFYNLAKLIDDYNKGKRSPETLQCRSAHCEHPSYGLDRTISTVRCLTRAETSLAAQLGSNGQWMRSKVVETASGLTDLVPAGEDGESTAAEVALSAIVQRTNTTGLEHYVCSAAAPTFNPVMDGIFNEEQRGFRRCVESVQLQASYLRGECARCETHRTFDQPLAQMHAGLGDRVLSEKGMKYMNQWLVLPDPACMGIAAQDYYVEKHPGIRNVLPNFAAFRAQSSSQMESPWGLLMLGVEDVIDNDFDYHCHTLGAMVDGKAVELQYTEQPVAMLSGVIAAEIEIPQFFIELYQVLIRRYHWLQVGNTRSPRHFASYCTRFGGIPWFVRKLGYGRGAVGPAEFMLEFMAPSFGDRDAVRNGIRKVVAEHYDGNPARLPYSAWVEFAMYFPEEARKWMAAMGQRLPGRNVTYEASLGMCGY